MYYNKISFNISPEPGQYTEQQYVTLSLSYQTTDISIYYSLNSSDYIPYTEPIHLANIIVGQDDIYNLNIKLVDNEHLNHSSSIYQYEYNISQIPHVFFTITNPNDSYIESDGSYNGYAVVTLSSSIEDIIYYTDDGTEPTIQSNIYTASLKYIVPGSLTEKVNKTIKTLISHSSYQTIQSSSFSISPKQVRIAQSDTNYVSDTNGVNYLVAYLSNPLISGSKIIINNYSCSQMYIDANSQNLNLLYNYCGNTRYPSGKYISINYFNSQHAQNNGHLLIYEINTSSLYISFSLSGYEFIQEQLISGLHYPAFLYLYSATGHAGAVRTYCRNSAGTNVLPNKNFGICQSSTLFTNVCNKSTTGFKDSLYISSNIPIIHALGANSYKRSNGTYVDPTKFHPYVIGVSAIGTGSYGPGLDFSPNNHLSAQSYTTP